MIIEFIVSSVVVLLALYGGICLMEKILIWRQK